MKRRNCVPTALPRDEAGRVFFRISGRARLWLAELYLWGLGVSKNLSEAASAYGTLWCRRYYELLWDTHLRYFAIIWYHLRYKSWHPVNRTRDQQSNPWNICATFRNTLVDRNQQASFWASQCMLFCFHLCCISLHFCAPFFKKNLFFNSFSSPLIRHAMTINDIQRNAIKSLLLNSKTNHA